jgi:galactokinase
MPPGTARERAVAEHSSRWGTPDRIARAPGRVNLIGEHTDYNDGFAMPMALPFDTVVVASDAGDAVDGPVLVQSEGFGSVAIDPSDDPLAVTPWARHIAGVVALLRAAGVPAGGWRAAVVTDIPTGASLSSSAAIEVAVTLSLLARAGMHWPPIDIARLGQRVENEVVGLPSGIMDQFISAGAVAGCASLMDCRAFTLVPRPVPADAIVAVMDTGTRRTLVDAEYADRRHACERAAAAIGVPALRDATTADLARVADEVDRRRARHVVTENDRTLAAADAMQRDDSGELGRLMTDSHVSLRDDFEVSSPALDAIVDAALAAPGCFGARMTGGGFAGCAVALVARGRAADFADAVRAAYGFDEHRAEVWLCTPAQGASITPLDAAG